MIKTAAAPAPKVNAAALLRRREEVLFGGEQVTAPVEALPDLVVAKARLEARLKELEQEAEAIRAKSKAWQAQRVAPALARYEAWCARNPNRPRLVQERAAQAIRKIKDKAFHDAAKGLPDKLTAIGGEATRMRIQYQSMCLRVARAQDQQAKVPPLFAAG